MVYNKHIYKWLTVFYFYAITVGTFKVSGVFPLSAGQSYCVPNGLLENLGECSCSSSAANLAKMDAVSDGNNNLFSWLNVVYDCLLPFIHCKF
jgi:hypothetical protein